MMTSQPDHVRFLSNSVLGVGGGKKTLRKKDTPWDSSNIFPLARCRRSECTKWTNISYRFHVVVLILMVLLRLSAVTSTDDVHRTRAELRLRCPPCRQIHCGIKDPAELKCEGGLTTGVCGCCPVCARLLGQSCGGDLTYLGKCDQGLVCRLNAKPAFPKYRHQHHRPGVCVNEPANSSQANAVRCRPPCTLNLCTLTPRAVCSASLVAETKKSCQGPCQHTSCRACAMMEESHECVRCTGDDFRCLKQFGRCVAQQFCSGKGKQWCKKKRLKEGPGQRFLCKVPDCPN